MVWIYAITNQPQIDLVGEIDSPINTYAPSPDK